MAIGELDPGYLELLGGSLSKTDSTAAAVLVDEVSTAAQANASLSQERIADAARRAAPIASSRLPWLFTADCFRGDHSANCAPGG